MFEASAIVTDRLFLRPIELGDAAATAALMTPAIAARLTTWPDRMTPAEASRRIVHSRNETKSGHWIDWGIFLKHDVSLIGWVGAGRKAERRAPLGLGYWLGEKFHGQGYASEAVEEIVVRAPRVFGVPEIEAVVQPDNAASLGVLHRLGFAERQRQFHHVPSRNRLEEFVCLALEQDDTRDRDLWQRVVPLRRYPAMLTPVPVRPY